MAAERPKNRQVEDENVKPGRPPRPSTEPPGAQPSSQSPKLNTDPGSGEPKPKPGAPKGWP
jgi:hypothetical protein